MYRLKNKSQRYPSEILQSLSFGKEMIACGSRQTIDKSSDGMEGADLIRTSFAIHCIDKAITYDELSCTELYTMISCDMSRGMGDDAATTTTTMVGGSNNERMLASSLSKGYNYRRNYIAIIEPRNFVSLFPNGRGIIEDILSFNGVSVQGQGSSTILNGNIYDPADIVIVNRSNDVEENDITDELIEFFDKFGDLPFTGGRQPKQPIPPGDSTFFYHGLCVANSAVDDPSPGTIPSVSSHSCKLNICLGGGGFNCIAFYSGSSFVFNLEPQLGLLLLNGNFLDKAAPSLPPPFPATIIGGTGSFEGIKGTVDIATICGTTGPTILEDLTSPCRRGRDRRLQEPQMVGDIKLGLIVQTISINLIMPLPVVP
ncbi:hypothetical protein FRACYDRAFT_235566 [Fragilariopsis cylindrus CCMP1102]|uniref:Uncharacterized protein n=1 Tax=Fragilariopsis cylindrus CCMP1102 TaxID=635003 RepID=A0A1E7FMW0_9STRA|nr:hypothetical protein FRACYDRAFT_235566 [Fragilariopsis cylindrus CCMP1102]|eukprot:OEU19509.1 hypothetical protein FRACYDRAFT_235566 [Fragilariopsis cylindrus CCMP1102]